MGFKCRTFLPHSTTCRLSSCHLKSYSLLYIFSPWNDRSVKNILRRFCLGSRLTWTRDFHETLLSARLWHYCSALFHLTAVKSFEIRIEKKQALPHTSNMIHTQLLIHLILKLKQAREQIRIRFEPILVFSDSYWSWKQHMPLDNLIRPILWSRDHLNSLSSVLE